MHGASLPLRADMRAKSIRIPKQPHACPVTLKLYDKNVLAAACSQGAPRRARSVRLFITRRSAPVPQVILAKGGFLWRINCKLVGILDRMSVSGTNGTGKSKPRSVKRKLFRPEQPGTGRAAPVPT